MASAGKLALLVAAALLGLAAPAAAQPAGLTPVCKLNATTQTHYLGFLNATKTRINPGWAWQPAPGEMSTSGNCKFMLDSNCSTMATGLCYNKSNNSCTTMGQCIWPGSPKNCPNGDTSCLFIGGHCGETPKADGTSCTASPDQPTLDSVPEGTDAACATPTSAGTCSSGTCKTVWTVKDDYSNCGSQTCNPFDECCSSCQSGTCTIVGHGPQMCCQQCTNPPCPSTCAPDYYTGKSPCACTAAGFCSALPEGTDTCFGYKK
eukprot:SM000041S15547  [mRNA]  locus=s41:759739:761134:+ [translate_table: standard]